MVATNKHTAPKDDDVTAAITIPTEHAPLNPAIRHTIDLRHMGALEVKTLKRTDPFLYYSIPGVLQATYKHREVDYSDIASPRHATPPQQSSESAQQSQRGGEVDASKVCRKTRVSFECHPDLLYEDLLDELDQEFGDLSLGYDDILSEFLGENGRSGPPQ